MVEFAVLSGVMVPLFFGVPMLGKLIDLRQMTVQASRYAAWEATVATSVGDGPLALDERFFGDPAAPIRSAPTTRGHNPLWGGPPSPTPAEVRSADPGARRTIGGVVGHPGGWPAMSAVTVDPASVSGTTAERSASSSVAGAVGAVVKRTGEMLGSSWHIGGNGLVDVGVTVAVRENGWLGSGSGGCGEGFACVREPSAILTDAWGAPDDTTTAERVRQLVPLHKLDWLGDSLAVVGKIPMLDELEDLNRNGESAFGFVDMSTDALPRDEIGEVSPGEGVELDYYRERGS